jgi:hypothetical protein
MIEHAGDSLRVTAPMVIVNARTQLEAGRLVLRARMLPAECSIFQRSPKWIPRP